jgi:hypothetical protein
MWAAFRLARARKARRLLYLEDDIRPCRNAVKRMLSLEVPETTSLITFHDVKEFRGPTPWGLYRMRYSGREGDGLWGSQAFLLSGQLIDFLCDHDPGAVWKRRGGSFSDRVLECFLSQSGINYYASHLPCLVEHRGEVSAAHPGKQLDRRQTTNFAGLDFDATSLPSYELQDIEEDCLERLVWSKALQDSVAEVKQVGPGLHNPRAVALAAMAGMTFRMRRVWDARERHLRLLLAEESEREDLTSPAGTSGSEDR